MKNEESVKLERKGSRRRFIKTAATASAFSILPAQSVWGACTVSGAVSGNQSRVNAQCTFPDISGGRSPGTWTKFVSGMPPGEANNKTKAIFEQVEDSGKNYDHLVCYRDFVRGLMSNTLISGSTLAYAATFPNTPPMPSGDISVEWGLTSNSMYNNVFFHAASAYMNAYLGMYNNYASGQASAEEVASEVFTYWLFSNMHGGSTDVGNLMNYYGEATTDYLLHSCAVYL